MSNVAVIVEHEPGPARAARALRGSPAHQPHDRLRRGAARPDHHLPAGDLRDLRTEDEVVEQVRRTVVHEVGHHFGIDDARLDRTRLVTPPG